MTTPGKLIVLEGPNGIGKETQAVALHHNLIALLDTYDIGVNVYFSFPDYSLDTGQKIRVYLSGKWPLRPKEAAILYAENRIAYRYSIANRLEAGYNVICNRYVPSNLAFQGGYIEDYEARVEFYQWLQRTEYDENRMPAPDLTIMLTGTPETARAHIAADPRRANIRDIHEENAAYLARVDACYAELPALFPEEKWVQIWCNEGDSKLTVAQTLWHTVDAVLQHGQPYPEKGAFLGDRTVPATAS